VERFLRGELTLEQLQSALRATISAAPAAASGVASYLDALHKQGRLPVQVYVLLKPLVSGDPSSDTTLPLSGGAPPVAADFDPTRVKPPVDATRPKPQSNALTAEDPTREQTAARPPRLAPATVPPTGTGSNWAHPEAWTRRHEGPIGPGSIIKERFVLETLLGQGGMGVVYKALDRRKQEARDRAPYVAIKILSEEFRRHADSLVALQREAVKAQTLAHPNIITVFDFDRDGTTVFMTMELLEGQALNRLISTYKLQGLPKDKAVPLIRGMAEALSYAHKKGIVHSDLKPGNVFLTRHDELKVLDFGIARAVATELRPDADHTVFDAGKLGALTPAYASAEMLRGAAPSAADDVFALGVIAHELLTGRHPFDRVPADTARLKGIVPAPIPGIARRQRKAIAKALALERAERQPDARAFLREFDGPTPIRKSAYAAMIVLAAALAYALYLNTQIKPDVAFDSLPADEQNRFFAAIAAAESALQVGDVALDDALNGFSTAYDIHRNNPAAIAGLESVADRVLEAMKVNDTGTRQRAVARLYCQQYLSTYRPVTAACEDLHGGACTWAAMNCPPREIE
jgi:serine/threonine protein kinase